MTDTYRPDSARDLLDVAGEVAVELDAVLADGATQAALEGLRVVRVEAVVQQVQRAVLEDDAAVAALVHLALADQVRHQALVLRLAAPP